MIVIEECAPYALGLRVKALAWETQARCRLDTFSLQDAFIHSFGTHADLLARHGLDASRIGARLGLE